MITDPTELDRALKAWPSRNLEQLVEELAHLGQRWRAGESVRQPRVSVVLRSGVVLGGVVLDLHHDRSGTRTLLLRELGHATHLPEALDVAHVPWGSIEALTVHDVSSLGRPPESVPISSASRAELERKAANVTEALAQKVGTPIDIKLELTGDDENEPLAWLLALVEDVVLDLAQGQHFADAMRGRVKQLKLGVGRHSHLAFIDGVLGIITAMAWNDRTTRESLRRELEALL
jgi:hypothetical protein